MSRNGRRDWRDEGDRDDGPFEQWRELGEHVCPVPGGVLRPGDPQRYFHHDLPGLSDVDLDLEQQRAIFRACLERDRPNLWWLLGRVERIREEQQRRSEMAGPPGEPLRGRLSPREPAAARAARRRAREHRIREEVDRALERQHHEEWLRWQAEMTKPKQAKEQRGAEMAHGLPRSPGGSQGHDGVGQESA